MTFESHRRLRVRPRLTGTEPPRLAERRAVQSDAPPARASLSLRLTGTQLAPSSPSPSPGPSSAGCCHGPTGGEPLPPQAAAGPLRLLVTVLVVTGTPCAGSSAAGPGRPG